MNNVNYKQVLASATLVLSCFIVSSAATAQGHASANQLEGGFTAGMSPTQTCELFKQNYTARSKFNTLCRNLDKDFANQTVVNKRISRSKMKGNPIKAVSFYFDKDQKLSDVVTLRQSHWDINLSVDVDNF